MVIKINTKQVGIPVEIGELKFTFDTSDNALEKLVGTAESFLSELAEIEGNDLKGAKKALQRGFDFLLGANAFEQIYEQTPSVLRCVEILEELVQSLTNELQNKNISTQQQKAEQYLNHKKKKKHKK